MDELNQIISESTEAVDEMYFQLNIDGGDPIYRERVYCYELYHQMRSRWPKETKYYLNGEIDKAAHPILRELGIGNKKPDFLIHTPGYMAGNFAIIEVKHINAARKDIIKDLETLSNFVNRVGYKKAIYLFYGYQSPDTIIEIVNNELKNIKVDLGPIELWFHSDVHSSALHIDTL